MNEFEINVDIKNNKLIAPIIELVQNDYNSAKLKFNFVGDDNYTKVLQLQLPDGCIWIKDIVNNEVVLADEKDGQIVPILVQNGKYIFDVAIYTDNAKLTTTNQESFFVRSELAGQDIELDDRLPILDGLINESRQVAKEADNLDIDIKTVDEDIIVEITKKDGSKESAIVSSGSALKENLVGEKYIVEKKVKGEIFNDYKNNIATGKYSHAEGESTTASGESSHAEGSWSKALANFSHTEGLLTKAEGESSHAEGNSTVAVGNYSHVEGYKGVASGESSHAEGYETQAIGKYSHAEGFNNIAKGFSSHSEGEGTQARGRLSHAEGGYTTAEGDYSHAEGDVSKANGRCSHAEGTATTANGEGSHAEGTATTASGKHSHAEGGATFTTSVAEFSHAEGYNTVANAKYQHVQGKYNVSDANMAHIVGNGTSSKPSNAHTIDWLGNGWFAGSLTINGNEKVATENKIKELEDKIKELEAKLNN